MAASSNPIKKRKRPFVFGILCLLVCLVALFGYHVYKTLYLPETLFTPSKYQTSPVPSGLDPSSSAPEATPYMQQTSIVNILLMGIDKEEGVKEKYGDTADCHTDSLILIAVNFDTNQVDLISLPRDTFVNMDGVDGFYKLNGIINYGGGKTEAGFTAVCEAAEWMLGGISVDYYCAFDVDKVVEIGDLLGGIDFDMDMAYRGSSGRRYKKGMQHLDGTGIMDYMRARKNATGEQGDKGRMNRCKKMLLALFEKLQTEGRLLDLPQLLSTIQSGVYTNITLQQQLALVNYAAKLSSDTIGMHTMTGSIHSAADWNFMFLDQEKRTELIQQVYGIEVSPQEHVSYKYALWLKEIGFRCIKYLRNGEKLQAHVQSLDPQTLSQEATAKYESLLSAQSALQEAFHTAEDTLSTSHLSSLLSALKTAAEALCDQLESPPALSWRLHSDWTKDLDVNTVFVDFR